ncbi:MAG: M14 family zinc carboxypeptidase [Phycisphaerales bacterium JB059]
MRYRWRQMMGIGVVALGLGHALAQPLATDPAEVVRYDGYALVRAVLNAPGDLEALESAGIRMLSCEPSPHGVDLLVPPGVGDVLEAMGLTSETLIEDIQPMIDAESARIRESLRRLARGEGDWYADYKPLDAIDDRIDELIARRPDLVSRSVIGTTHEGRPIWVMRISGETGGACKPGFLLNGLTHAREWITPMNVMYLAESLVDGYGVDPEITSIVDQMEWFIIPVLNPDGYAFSWTTNRMWRKNRAPHPQIASRRGVDLNRNYGVDWGHDEGSSPAPYADLYRGLAPFSELETSALRDFVLAHPNIRGHNDTHSYGEMILFPWGFRPAKILEYVEYYKLGLEMNSLIRDEGGAFFAIGPVQHTLYTISGGSTDWFYEVAGAWTYMYELRGSSFDPDPSEIRPGAEETFRATLLHASRVIETTTFRADLDGDCDFDYGDVLAFLAAFASGDPVADFNQDTAFDAGDVLLFLELFSEGA